MENSEKLQAKLGSITRGAYYFGIIGRAGILWGIGQFLFIPVLAASGGVTLPAASLLVSNGLQSMIVGYVFLVARDALEAVEALIREIGEIV